MVIRLTQIDGKLPNLALMKLASFYKQRGHSVVLTKSVDKDMFEPEYKFVYGSAIFSYSAPRVARLRSAYPNAVIGGTWDTSSRTTVEDIVGEHIGVDYSIYPSFSASIGFTQRGCRLKCGFCVVPKKEGKPASVATINDIWRGEPHPKNIHLLDNDFFGQPREQWESRINEIRAGSFKVCFNQGVNARMIDDDAAFALASVKYYDDSFTTRRLYTAWDNVGDEAIFMRGVETLEKHGVPPSHLLVYMLVGYDRRETWERVLYRFNKMASLKMRPYPMVYGDKNRTLPLGGCNLRIGNRTLGDFQRWAIRRAYTFVPFDAYDAKARGRATMDASLFETRQHGDMA